MTRPMSTVDAPTLAERLGGSPGSVGSAPTLIDVRTAAEFEAGHIPGAVNVPLDELKGSLDDVCAVLDDHDVVLVCRSGTRAGQAQEALHRAGLGSSAVLRGGIADWEATGGELDRGRQAWELERQVRLAAGSLVVAGIAASAVAPRARWLSAAVGGGLVFAALSDTCAMGLALARMPWNTRGARATGSALDQLTTRR
jgi:rhodanese-related sulfurtransferase